MAWLNVLIFITAIAGPAADEQNAGAGTASPSQEKTGGQETSSAKSADPPSPPLRRRTRRPSRQLGKSAKAKKKAAAAAKAAKSNRDSRGACPHPGRDEEAAQ